MTTFAIALGVSGTLQYRPDYRSLSTVTGDFADIRTGAKNWPMWPDPLLDYTNSDNYNDPKSIDDYWHTAVNGRGRFFSANNPTSVVQGLGDALAKIDNVLASGAPIGTSTLQPVSGNNFAYATSYQSGSWEGDLQASTIDLATGAPTAAVWSASALLGAKTFAACDNRQIFVMRGSSPLGAFTWNTDVCPAGTPTGTLVTGLNAAEQAFFSALNVSLLSQFPYMHRAAFSDDPVLAEMLDAGGEYAWRVRGEEHMRRGQSLVVWAIREGRQAARAIDEFLTGSSTLPR